MPVEQRKAILPYCHYLIERFPVGRDFGAYKRGLIWFKDSGKLSDADVVVEVPSRSGFAGGCGGSSHCPDRMAAPSMVFAPIPIARCATLGWGGGGTP
jgi:hypothetical protein